ncbi:MAG: hypothetical protein LBM75_05210 [Myxococcales bacterium]|jgi:Flp pilus assembly protein TadB|nr:hypothetical protein [Myxococcales bacterium]
MPSKPTSTVRSALPHPPRWLPNYCARSAFHGVELAEPGHDKSRRLALYDALAEQDFAAIPEDVSDADLAWLDGFLALKLEAEREERRMHFGAFALVGVLFFLLMPTLVTGTASLAMLLLALLLIVLLVPYTLVYFGYENRVRAMAIGRMRLWEARARRAEK